MARGSVNILTKSFEQAIGSSNETIKKNKKYHFTLKTKIATELLHTKEWQMLKKAPLYESEHHCKSLKEKK